MRRSIFSASTMFLCLALFLALSAASPALADIVFQPQAISPERVGIWGHIHTDIPYNCVTSVEVLVEGTVPQALTTFADDCGNLVAKFKLPAVERGDESLSVSFSASGATAECSGTADFAVPVATANSKKQ